MTTRRRTLLTAALCLGAIAILPTAGTAQAQTRSRNTYNALKQHVHKHVRMIHRIEKNRDYAILPKVLDRLERLVIAEVLPFDVPLGPDPDPMRKLMVIHPHFIIDSYYVINPYFIVCPELILADLYATAVMVGDLELVDDLEYLSRVMAVVDR